MRMRTFIALIVMLNLPLLGCGLHLYDKGRDDQAQKALSTFTEVKIQDIVAEQRANLTAIKDYEDAVIRRNVISRRDADLDKLAFYPDRQVMDQLGNRVAQRILTVTGIALPPYRPGQNRYQAVQNLIATLGDPKKTCAFQGYSSFRTGPELLVANANYCKLQDSKAALQKEISARFAKYSSAKHSYESRAAVGKPILGSYSSSLATVQKNLVKFGNISSYEAKIPKPYKGYYSAVNIKVLQEQIAASERVLTALQKENAEGVKSDGEKEIFLSVEMATHLTDLGDKISKEYRKKNLNAILLATNNLKYELELEQKKLAHAENRSKLLSQYKNAYLEELKLLISSIRQLDIPDTCIGDCIDDRRRFALLQYARSWTSGRLQEELRDYQMMDEYYDEAADNSEVALEQWSNVMTISLQSLSGFHSSGLKEETIATLLSAAAITAAIGAK